MSLLRKIDRRTKWIAAAGAGVCVALLLGVVLWVQTDHGFVRIKFSDPYPHVKVTIDGRVIRVAGPGGPIKIRTGEHELRVSGTGFETVCTSFRIVRGKERVLSVKLIPAAGTSPKKAAEAQLPELVALPVGDRRVTEIEHYCRQSRAMWTTRNFADAEKQLTLWPEHRVRFSQDENEEVSVQTSQQRVRQLQQLSAHLKRVVPTINTPTYQVCGQIAMVRHIPACLLVDDQWQIAGELAVLVRSQDVWRTVGAVAGDWYVDTESAADPNDQDHIAIKAVLGDLAESLMSQTTRASARSCTRNFTALCASPKTWIR